MTTHDLLRAIPGNENWEKDRWLRNWIAEVQQTLLSLYDGDWSRVEAERPLDVYAIRRKEELLGILRAGRIGPCFPVYSGRLYWPLCPRPEDISLEDIAHVLAGIGRFNHHQPKNRLPVSVAQHSIFVSRQVSPSAALLGLMHDATEVYLHDVISPVKALLQPAYGELERLCWSAIVARFSIPESPELWAEVKQADQRALLTEGLVCMPQSGLWLDSPVPVYAETIPEMPRHDAERAFLERFAELTNV